MKKKNSNTLEGIKKYVESRRKELIAIGRKDLADLYKDYYKEKTNG